MSVAITTMNTTVAMPSIIHHSAPILAAAGPAASSADCIPGARCRERAGTPRREPSLAFRHYNSAVPEPGAAMLIRKPEDIRSSEITDEATYVGRRKFIGIAAGAGAALVAAGALKSLRANGAAVDAEASLAQQDAPTPYEDVTTYNNFYEFGTGKDDPARH